MLRKGLPWTIISFTVFMFLGCIDPYTPDFKDHKSLLVVDGLITDENRPYSVQISRTFQDMSISPEKVSGAKVFLTDTDHNIEYLEDKGDGIYKTDSTQFTGTVGSEYVLHIITSQGEEYESNPCMMYPVADIDSIYFKRGEAFVSNATENLEGIRIWLDTKRDDNNSNYRWAYEETWKFRIPSPPRYTYIDHNNIVGIPKAKQYCWKTGKSDQILIHATPSGNNESILKKPLNFVASDRSDRLMVEYSILIKQYSISNAEYDFWENLNKVNESGSDIFASQPYPVISNIHNINNSSERVLGYFQVSSVKQKRIFIPFSAIIKLGLPFYHNEECRKIEAAPSDYSSPFGLPVTFDDLYVIFCVNADYLFIEPVYNADTHQLEKLVFAPPECTSCDLTGTMVRPDYWVDLN